MAPRKKLNSGGISIRLASAEDVPDVSRIGGQSFPGSDVSEEKTISRLKAGHVIFIAEMEGEIAGFIDTKLALTSVRVLGFATDSRFRGKGVGTALLEHAIRFARDSGKISVRLRVAARNLRALNLYRKLGFIVIKRRARIDGRAIYTMARNFET